MVVGVTDGYVKRLEIVGTGYRVHGRRAATSEFALGYSHPVPIKAPEGIKFTRREPDPFLGRGHRQAAGRRGRRQDPQAAQARPVQGQGRALRRARSFAARPERQVRSNGRIHDRQAARRVRPASRPHARSPSRVGTSGCARRSPARPSVRAWSSPAPRGTCSCRSSTTPRAKSRWPRPRRTSSPTATRRRAGQGALGAQLAEAAKAAGVTKVVFDRGGSTYTGRIAAFADAARDAGLEF